MTHEETARLIERDYYAELAAIHDDESAKDEFPSLRDYLHERGFSYKWLTQHGYIEQDA